MIKPQGTTLRRRENYKSMIYRIIGLHKSPKTRSFLCGNIFIKLKAQPAQLV